MAVSTFFEISAISFARVSVINLVNSCFPNESRKFELMILFNWLSAIDSVATV